MNERLTYLKAIVFDWAGTVIDFGSCAPAAVFQRVFANYGIELSSAQAREPMGMAKREHIAAIGRMPDVRRAWLQRHGREFTTTDVDRIYHEFLPLQKQVLSEYSVLIPGAKEAIDQCRALGLKIGSSTGYTRELMQVVSASAKDQGYEPSCVLCAEDVLKGRPAPYLLFAAAMQMDVYPMRTIVNVDDTAVGIEAGRNAGCWTIGVTKTGNCVGLSEAELSQLSDLEVDSLCKVAGEKLRSAGAHYLVESVAEIPLLLGIMDRRAASGITPDSC